MVWMMNKQIQLGRWKGTRLWGGAFLCWVFIMLATPKVPLSHSKHHHLFADKRNFLGVPNTWNVLTNYPFLIVGVVGLVLSISGSFVNISLRGEAWGWAIFFGGIVAAAFGSTYYHLMPEDGRIMWDTLPMMVAYSALLSSFIVERVGHRVGLSCLFGLLFFVLLSIVYARTFNDLRLGMMFQLIPCVVIPAISFWYPPQYTHSIYWFWAAGACLISKFEAILDKKLYNANRFFLSGHSLGHLFSSGVPVLLTVMLILRNLRCERLGDVKDLS